MAGHASGWIKRPGSAKGSVFVSKAALGGMTMQAFKYTLGTLSDKKAGALLDTYAAKSVQPAGQALKKMKQVAGSGWDAAQAKLDAASEATKAAVAKQIKGYIPVSGPKDKTDIVGWYEAGGMAIDRALELSSFERIENDHPDLYQATEDLLKTWNLPAAASGLYTYQTSKPQETKLALAEWPKFLGRVNDLITQMREALLDVDGAGAKAKAAAAAKAAAKASGQQSMF